MQVVALLTVQPPLQLPEELVLILTVGVVAEPAQQKQD